MVKRDPDELEEEAFDESEVGVSSFCNWLNFSGLLCAHYVLSLSFFFFNSQILLFICVSNVDYLN